MCFFSRMALIVDNSASVHVDLMRSPTLNSLRLSSAFSDVFLPILHEPLGKHPALYNTFECSTEVR
jgi:hypothetical protein